MSESSMRRKPVGGGSRERNMNHSQHTPWLTARQAAQRANCGLKLIYREVQAKRLRAVQIGGRRELRFRAEWIDEWLEGYSTIQPTI